MLETVSGHNHARHPEEDDVRSRDKIRSGIEFGAGFLIHGGERPQPGGEPCVHYVVVLNPVVRVLGRFGSHVEEALFQCGGVQRRGVPEFFRLVFAVPDRDAMAPPELSGDAPVLNVFQPVGVGFRPARGAKSDIPSRYGVRGFFHAGVFEEPLHGEARFNRDIGAFGEPDFVIIVFNVDHEAGDFQHFHGFAACVKAVHAVEFGHFRAVDMTVGGKDVDNFQVEFPAYFKVGLIMGRSDFQSARAEFYFYIFISDDRNGGGIERAHDVFPDEVGVPRILRVDGHSHVRHDGFRAGGGYMEGSGPVFQFVKNGVELAFLLSHDDFFIREGREGYRAPVDHAAAPVDESFLKEFNEDLSNGFGVFLIHREAFAIPVAGTTQLMELVDDDASVFFFPFPDFFQEGFSAQIVAAPARCLFEVFFHPYLRGDSGMVCSGQPEGFISFLARAAHQDVLDGVVQYMAQMQHSRDVGGRDDDRVGRLFRSRVSLETTFFNPAGLPFFFHQGGIVCFGQIRHGQKGSIKFFSFNPYLSGRGWKDGSFSPE